MKKNFLALGAVAVLFFACNGGGDKFVGRWVGNMQGTMDTFNVVKSGDNYSLTHGATKMDGTAKGDTLVVSIDKASTVKFGYNKTTKQLSIVVGTNTFNYDKK
jgi:hypothetical protein